MLFCQKFCDSKKIKNSDKFMLCFIFHVKIKNKTIKLLFCVISVSIKLPRHDIPKNNYHLNDTIFFFVIVLCHLVLLVKKSVTTDP